MSDAWMLGKRGKTPPCYESGSWAALQFSRWEKILNVSQRIHLRFFPIVKTEYQPNLHFLATGRFCLASLGECCDLRAHVIIKRKRRVAYAGSRRYIVSDCKELRTWYDHRIKEIGDLMSR